MAKIYKMTEAQAKLIAEHLKKQKLPLTEEMSPEAAQYYAANPEALAKKEAEDAEKLKEQQPQAQADPALQAVVDAAQALLQKQGVQPKPAATPSMGTSSTEPAPAPAAAPAPTSGGPTPAPTGDETAAPSPDSTEALKAKADTAVEPMAETEPGAQGGGDYIDYEETPNPPSTTPEAPLESTGEDLFFKTVLKRSGGESQIYHSTDMSQGTVFGFPPNHEVTDIYGDLTVVWTLDFDVFADQSGIERIKIEVKNVTGHLQPEYVDDLDKYQKTDFPFDANALGFKYQVDFTVNENALVPRSIDVDWTRKLIILD